MPIILRALSCKPRETGSSAIVTAKGLSEANGEDVCGRPSTILIPYCTPVSCLRWLSCSEGRCRPFFGNNGNFPDRRRNKSCAIKSSIYHLASVRIERGVGGL